MSESEDPDRGGQPAEHHDEYEALFREPVVRSAPAPKRAWWRWPWGGSRRDEPANALSGEGAAMASQVEELAAAVEPAPVVIEAPRVSEQTVAQTTMSSSTSPPEAVPAPAFTPRRTKRKRGAARKTEAPVAPGPVVVAVAPVVAPTAETSAPAIEEVVAPEPAPSVPETDAIPEPVPVVPEIIAIPEPEPAPAPESELREEDLPTGRPGPYVDPATEIPVYTDEQIEAQIGPPPPRRRLGAMALLVVAALAAFGTGMFVFNNLIMPRFIHSTAEVKVPDLANLNYDQAEIALKPLGLVLARAGERFDPAVPRGFILSQDPAPETPVRGRKRVMVVVSLGEEFSSVPSLFGESLRSARFLLERSGLRVTGITRAPSDEVGEGLIAGTDPPAENVLPRNASVALLVSSGTGQEQYVMPDLVGREIAGVRRHLESLGFRVITPPAAPSVGAIVYQEPAAGSRITLDTPISLQATGRIIR